MTAKMNLFALVALLFSVVAPLLVQARTLAHAKRPLEEAWQSKHDDTNSYSWLERDSRMHLHGAKPLAIRPSSSLANRGPPGFISGAPGIVSGLVVPPAPGPPGPPGLPPNPGPPRPVPPTSSNARGRTSGSPGGANGLMPPEWLATALRNAAEPEAASVHGREGDGVKSSSKQLHSIHGAGARPQGDSRVLSAAGPIAGHGPRPSPAARHQKDAKVGPVPIVWLTAGDKSGSKSDVEDLGHAQGARPEVSRSGPALPHVALRFEDAEKTIVAGTGDIEQLLDQILQNIGQWISLGDDDSDSEKGMAELASAINKQSIADVCSVSVDFDLACEIPKNGKHNDGEGCKACGDYKCKPSGGGGKYVCENDCGRSYTFHDCNYKFYCTVSEYDDLVQCYDDCGDYFCLDADTFWGILNEWNEGNCFQCFSSGYDDTIECYNECGQFYISITWYIPSEVYCFVKPDLQIVSCEVAGTGSIIDHDLYQFFSIESIECRVDCINYNFEVECCINECTGELEYIFYDLFICEQYAGEEVSGGVEIYCDATNEITSCYDTCGYTVRFFRSSELYNYVVGSGCVVCEPIGTATDFYCYDDCGSSNISYYVYEAQQHIAKRHQQQDLVADPELESSSNSKRAPFEKSIEELAGDREMIHGRKMRFPRAWEELSSGNNAS